MWQEVAILLTGIFSIAYVGWKIYRMFTAKRKANSPCNGCSGCALKDHKP